MQQVSGEAGFGSFRRGSGAGRDRTAATFSACLTSGWLPKTSCHAGGGPAATAAVAFARLGGQAHFVGAIGDDAAGEEILAGLRAESVDVTGVIPVAGARSMRCVIVADRGHATRAICALPGPVLRIPQDSRRCGADLPRRLGARRSLRLAAGA